jgi:hypothetical protein
MTLDGLLSPRAKNLVVVRQETWSNDEDPSCSVQCLGMTPLAHAALVRVMSEVVAPARETRIRHTLPPR